ncbi:FtsK/SpoIIIE domain-containing protein [Microbacterium sp. DT81.1]|uniref:FtsK/SpoIIIE domain-containing protein n=1 Tax=Microbacterium sp. DT81.1 TaxID=3393413 RepID=UPI003CF5525A
MTSLSEPLILPAPPEPRRRGPLPLLASIVPLVGGVAMWLVTGSPLGLCFAALGPLMAVASVIDGAGSARRDRRRAAREGAAARARILEEMSTRHGLEREALDARRPDVAGLVQTPERVWRPIGGGSPELVIGRGTSASAVRVVGGDPALRARAATLEDAPLSVPLAAGVCVEGPPAIAEAALRSLVVQLCLAHAPDALTIVSTPSSDEEWTRLLPHRASAGPSRAGLRLAVLGPGDTAPPGADVVLAHVQAGNPPPTRCGALVRVTRPGAAELSWNGENSAIALEYVSRAQAGAIAAALSRRAADAAPLEAPAVSLADTLHAAPPCSAGLAAAIGMDGTAPVVLDLVRDGPHAVVAGVTGSGKSELLITWITSICAGHSTREVSFLLADFKGGTAFDALARLPHVTGVLTDLDAAGSRRAVESLRAELRWREAELARLGARDILDERAEMPRLVIVVDEFAAMLAEHPDLHAVFTDVAARGRALGMHLVLGTQRVSGVVRDALLANCPLRLSLRVTDAADSRAVIGTDDAAQLAGEAASRGVAFVRRAEDAHPRRMRVALSAQNDIEAILERRGSEPRPRRPWLPALPTRVPLAALQGAGGTGGVVIGLADDPDRQRQEVIAIDLGRDRGMMVVGGPGSGKTGILRVVAAQHPGALVVPRDPEGAWDMLTAECPPGSVVLLDDADALLARLSQEHARALADRLEHFARDAGLTGSFLVLSAQRPTGALSRVADLLPVRAVLGLPSRADHLAAGGESESYLPWRPPGRGRLGGREVQFAEAPAGNGEASLAVSPDERFWMPRTTLTGVVTRGVARVTAQLSEAWDARVVGIGSLVPGARVADLLREAGDERIVLVGDGESWQAHWGLLQTLRVDHPLLVDAACPTELRTIAGERELPPFARAGAGRAWLCSPDHPPRRVALPLTGA